MTQKERLVELLKDAGSKAFNGIGVSFDDFHNQFADYLLQSGVIVPPCKVGDTVYRLVIDCADASENDCDGHCWSCKYLIANITDEIVIDHNHQIAVMNLYGLHYFSNREEAERALKELNDEKNN